MTKPVEKILIDLINFKIFYTFFLLQLMFNQSVNATILCLNNNLLKL